MIAVMGIAQLQNEGIFPVDDNRFHFPFTLVETPDFQLLFRDYLDGTLQMPLDVRVCNLLRDLQSELFTFGNLVVDMKIDPVFIEIIPAQFAVLVSGGRLTQTRERFLFVSPAAAPR